MICLEGPRRSEREMDMNIFVIEDDESIFQSLQEKLGQWSLTVTGTNNIHDMMTSFIEAKPHLVIIDIQLPAYYVIHCCREIRAISYVPIIFLSSRDLTFIMVISMNL